MIDEYGQNDYFHIWQKGTNFKADSTGTLANQF